VKREDLRTIERNLAQSRQLGEQMDRAGDEVVAGLRRAARSGRYRSAKTGRYVTRSYAKP
jgi:hypothetical protein